MLNSCISVWLKIKGFKKAYLRGEHLLVICRPLAIWTTEENRVEEKLGRGEAIRPDGMKEKGRKRRRSD